ncbi:unnamed protein product [Paramecium octaurelia]|uniref:PNPLA domain-containing protein n=1 Tax=Paramecium octaurelia TaxID=43137 RepID=A0A8S1UR10_PAROT|nr:unnamed protein product [Paramecium octaurelia]
MKQLEQFANTFYDLLQAQPQKLSNFRVKLKFLLSQLKFQYSDLLEEQQKQAKKSPNDTNIIQNLISNLQSVDRRDHQIEQNELIFCNKLQELLRKLKKPQIENLKDLAQEVLTADIKLLQDISKIIHSISPLHEILSQLKNYIAKENTYYEDKALLKCPLQTIHAITKETASSLIKGDQNLISMLEAQGYQIKRLKNNEEIFYYQRYLVSYVLKSLIFQLQLPPGFVIRISSYESKNKELRKQYSYFFITAKVVQSDLVIDKIEFAKHYLSLQCTDHLDSVIPQYYGDLQASFSKDISPQLTMYEQFKNPLLYYKKYIFEETYKPAEFDKFQPQNIFENLLNFFQFLSDTQLNDFHYKQEEKNEVVRYKSLQVTYDMMQLTYQRIKKLEDALITVQEVIFPQQLCVRLIQITEKMNQVFFQFQRLDTSRFSTLSEYQEYLGKINLEELIHKIIDAKHITKYNNQIRQIKQDLNQLEQQHEKSVGKQTQNLNLLSQYYLQGPKWIIINCCQKIDIQYEISLTNRIKLLDFLANLNFHLDTQFVSQQEHIYDSIVKGFNDSWFELDLWKQAFKANYSIQSQCQFNNTLFVELLAILFFKENYTKLNLNIFESLEQVQENEKNSHILILYLMNKCFKGDLGFGKHITLVESALKHKKFYLVLKLLENNQGQKIRFEYFNYLLDETQNLFSQSAYFSNLSENDTKYHEQIFDQIAKIHPQLEGRLRWDHFWNQIVKNFGDHTLKILGRGFWSLKDEQYKQIFVNNQLGNQGEIPSYLELSLIAQINKNNNKNYSVLKVNDPFINQLLFIQPNFPLQKFMASQLYQLLQLDQFSSRVELIQSDQQIYSVYQVISQFNNNKRSKVTIAQFLQHNEYNEQRLRNCIGNYNLANKIVLCILLLSTNTSPDEELLVPCGNYLSPVSTNFYFNPQFDNFINSHGFERDGESVKLCCHNIYFLMQFMKEKIDYQLLQNFQNITLTIQQWLKQLSQIEATASQSAGLLLLPLYKENMIELVRRATIIQNLITKPNFHITYLDLLKLCDKNLGEFYQILIENHTLNLINKFVELPQLSTNSDSLILSDFITFRESFAYMKYPSGFNVRNMIGPYKGLKMFLKYSRLLSTTTLQNFHKKLAVVKKQQHFQMLMKSFEWRNFKDNEVQIAFQLLSDYSKDFNKSFELVNFKELQSKQFPQLFQSLQLIRIKILNLSYVDAVNDNFLFDIAQHCTELHVLNLSGCQNVHQIGQTSNILNIGNQKPLQFQRLKTLIAQNLPNVKSIEISGQFLQNLNVNYCKNLQTVYTNKIKLTRVQAKGCVSLQLEIVQLWIIQGVRILFDEHTSQGSLKGFVQPQLIIDVDKEFIYDKIYLEMIFQLLSDLYDKILHQDQYIKSPFPQFFLKNGIISDDFEFQFRGFLQNKLDEQNKKKILQCLFTCLFQNEQIKQLDLKSMLKNRGQERIKILDQFLGDFIQAIHLTIEDQDSKIKQIAKEFFLNIESLTIPCSKEDIIDKVAQLIRQIQNYRTTLNISFTNLKVIGNDIIGKFFEKIQRNDKQIHIQQIDFSGNSLERENLKNIFQVNNIIQVNIQQLILRNAGIDDKILLEIAEYFWECENLKIIDLSQNHLTKKSLNKLFEDGRNLAKIPLNNINLSENSIGDANFQILAEIEEKQWQNKEQNMLYLKSTILRNCFEQNLDIQPFCDFVAQSYMLQILDLRKNSFSEEGMQQLSKSIGKSKSLTTLYYQNNIKTSKAILIQEIMKNTHLNSLEIILSHQEHYDEEFLKIFNFSNLKNLEITLPSITEEEMKQLVDLLKSNISLVKFKLNITNNDIKQRTFYKLGLSKIKNIMEIKEECNKDIYFYDPFYKQDTLRIDVQDYCQMGLSIDGGGIRGLMPATIINYICSEIKKEPYQIFDCVGGTSIGGILALAMTGTQDGVHPLADKDQLVKFFTEDGKIIFDQQKRGVWSLINKSKYDAKGIESVLQRYAGTAKLSETLPHTNVIVTAVKLQKHKGDNMAKVFSSRKAKLDLTENFLIKDVGRATSAAPTYFPAAQIKSLAGKEYQFIDGGVGKNNPANLVLDDLKKGMLNKDKDNFFVLSISTGVSKQKQHLQIDEGIMGVVRILDAFGESNQDFVDLELKKNQGKYLRIVPEYDLPESQAQLDCTDIKILEEYQSAATTAASQFLEQEKFGQYQDKTFIKWLEENTARRLESL